MKKPRRPCARARAPANWSDDIRRDDTVNRGQPSAFPSPLSLSLSRNSAGSVRALRARGVSSSGASARAHNSRQVTNHHRSTLTCLPSPSLPDPHAQRVDVDGRPGRRKLPRLLVDLAAPRLRNPRERERERERCHHFYRHSLFTARSTCLTNVSPFPPASSSSLSCL
jgi:hypothetical protein